MDKYFFSFSLVFVVSFRSVFSFVITGVFALVLEANPRLTWRDLQHLIVKTSKVVSPNDSDWQINAAGHKVETRNFGTSMDSI